MSTALRLPASGPYTPGHVMARRKQMQLALFWMNIPIEESTQQPLTKELEGGTRQELILQYDEYSAACIRW